MAKMITPFLVFLIAIQAFSLSTASSENALEFDNPESSVTGQLLQWLGYGETGYVLLLDEPITIEGNPDSRRHANKKTVRNIQRIMIVFSTEQPKSDTLGHVYVITGRLQNESSDSRSQYILMNADTFSIIEEVVSSRPVAIFETH